jgi:ribosomal protein S20
MIKRLKASENPDEATVLLNETKAYLDRLAAKGIYKKNTVANYKSKLEKRVHALT